MIEWYKQHCRVFIGEGDGATQTGSKRKNRSTIKDLRENMVASVVCKVRPPKENKLGAEGDAVASELDGVLLCELFMYDTVRDAMTVNLWNQHAEKRFVARLLEHHGAIEIDGIVVGLQALSNRLLANTTPHTTFRLLDVEDPESVDLAKKIAGVANIGQNPSLAKSSGPTRFTALDELEVSLFKGQATLDNVRVEQVGLGRHFGSETTVLAKFSPQLAERYCTGCDQVLPTLAHRDNPAKLRFGTCANSCKNRRGSTVDAPCGWRYRRISMILRDCRNERLQVEVDSNAMVEIVGNIEAQVVVESCEDPAASPSSHLHTASAVASMLNALVDDANQKFEALMMCSSVKTQDRASPPSDSYLASSHGEDGSARRVFNPVSLAPSNPFTV